MATASYTGTRQDLRAVLQKLPQILAGAAPDPWGIVRGIQLLLGVALLSKIQTAFIVKSRGGVGSDGIKWPPLKRETIAGRRPPPHKRRGERPMGLLTVAQDKRWRQIFGQERGRLMAKFGLSPADASARAGQLAWARLKAEGAKTRIGTLGDRQVDIGRDNGILFRSLNPGVDDKPSGEADQVFETPPGRVIVGSNVPYFPHFHRRRPVWPLDGRLPDAWAEDLMGTLKRGILQAAMLLVTGGKTA